MYGRRIDAIIFRSSRSGHQQRGCSPSSPQHGTESSSRHGDRFRSSDGEQGTTIGPTRQAQSGSAASNENGQASAEHGFAVRSRLGRTVRFAGQVVRRITHPPPQGSPDTSGSSDSYSGRTGRCRSPYAAVGQWIGLGAAGYVADS